MEVIAVSSLFGRFRSSIAHSFIHDCMKLQFIIKGAYKMYMERKWNVR
jgi:hypothetical protein